MTAGMRSSEWWLALVAALLGAFVGSGIVPSEHWSIKLAGIGLMALSTLGYSVSRGLAKSAGPVAMLALLLMGSSGCPATIAGRLQRAQTDITATGKAGLEAYHARCSQHAMECGARPVTSTSQPAETQTCTPYYDCLASKHAFEQAIKAVNAELELANRTVWGAGVAGAKP